MASFDERQPKTSPARTSKPELGANGKPVGYRNPPKRTQFIESGNPGGRRKNPPSLDFDSILVRVMESKFGDKTFIEMAIDALLKKVLLGDTSAWDRLIPPYARAKQNQRRNGNDHVADQAAAERLLGSLRDYMTGTAPADDHETEVAKKPTSDE